jgi:hypothetical protein
VNGAGGNTSSDARGFDAPVRPDAVHQRQARADLILRDIEHTLLFVECARSDFGRVCVDGDRRQALDRSHIAQVPAEACLVDREIVVERQEHCRNHAVRNISLPLCHEPSPSEIAAASIIQTTSAPPSI